MARKKKETEIPEIPAVEEVQVQVPVHVPALQKCLPHAEKTRLMVREVLREECGRELANGTRARNEEFDWGSFNEEFRQDYENSTLKELMGYCARLYGLKSLDEIRERRSSHKKARSKRFNSSNFTNKPSTKTEDDDEFIDDDIETEDIDEI